MVEKGNPVTYSENPEVKVRCDQCRVWVVGWWDIKGKILCLACYLTLGEEELS